MNHLIDNSSVSAEQQIALMRQMDADPGFNLSGAIFKRHRSYPWMEGLTQLLSLETLVSLARNTNFESFREKSVRDPGNLLISDPRLEVHLALASNQHLADSQVSQLSTDGAVEVRCAIAACARLPVRALENLSKDAAAEVRRILARHPALGNRQIGRLVRDQDLEVKLALIERLNQLISSDVFNELTKTKTKETQLLSLAGEAVEVRAALDAKTHLPKSEYKKLSKDRSAEVRRILASQLEIGARLTLRLAADEDPKVRAAAVENTGIGRYEVAKLGHAPCREVRRAVFERLARDRWDYPPEVPEMLRELSKEFGTIPEASTKESEPDPESDSEDEIKTRPATETVMPVAPTVFRSEWHQGTFSHLGSG